MRATSLKDVASISVNFAEELKIFRCCLTFRSVGIASSDDGECAQSKYAGYNVSASTDADPFSKCVHVWRINVW